MWIAIWGVIQFILFVCLAPLILTITTSFQNEIMTLRPEYREYFEWGIVAYVLSNLFAYDFYGPYSFGRRVVTEIFKFLGPLAQVLSYVVSIFTLLVIAIYFFIGLFLKIGPDTSFYFLLVGFTLSMHIVLSAKDLYDNEKLMFKPSYFFSMTLVYIASLMLMAFILDVAILEFSFPHFFGAFLDASEKLYALIYARLF